MIENTQNSNSYFGFGRTQNNRLLKALDPNNVKLDDRELSDLLAFTTDYVSTIKYFNDKNLEDGFWHHFYLNDISVILANIVSTDLNTLEAQYNDILRKIYSTKTYQKRIRTFEELFAHIYNIATLFNDWYQQILEVNLLDKQFESIIENELFGIIQEKVKDNVQYLKSIALGADNKDAIGRSMDISFEHFDTIWELDEVKAINIFEGEEPLEKVMTALLKLRLLYRTMHQALSYTAFHFKKYFKKSLENKNDHKPHIALYLTFLKLFKYIQNDYNLISSRYLSYYYKEYLRQIPRKGIPDRVYVAFELSNHVKRYILPANTQLDAGLNEKGETVVYQTTNEVELTKAKIKSLKTIYIGRRDSSYHTNYRLVTDIYSANEINAVIGEDVSSPKSLDGWALFGEEQEYKPIDIQTMDRADIGFALASPIFSLREGDRNVELKITFNPNSTKIYKKLIIDFYESVNADKGKNDTKITLEEVFYNRIFSQVDDNVRSLNLYMSGSQGWVEIPTRTISIKASGNGDWSIDRERDLNQNLEILDALTISFKVPADKPPIVPFNPAVIKDGAYATKHPILKVLLNPNHPPFSYSFLKDLELETIDIKVDVKGLKNVTIINDIGILDNKQPFAAFGAQPSIGTSLLIGNAELFKKKLSNVNIDIEWKDIPPTTDQFKAHYAHYGEEFNPSEYKVKLTALSENEFMPDRKDDSTIIPLFSHTVEPSTAPIEDLVETSIKIDEVLLSYLDIRPDPELREVENFNNNTRSGYLKLELVSPQEAFGHYLYQNAFTEAVTKKGYAKGGDIEGVPQLPYTPTIQEMTIGYTASTVLMLNGGSQDTQERVYHIHPFGIANIYRNGILENKTLLPRFIEDGYLHIGIENAYPPETISIFFQLTSKKSKTFNTFNIPKVKWSYLSRNQWRDFEDRDILFDGTDNFTKSGIIRLNLPRSVSSRNTILEKGLCWLRASVIGDVDVLCQAVDIRTQVVMVERIGEDISKEPLAPNTIQSLVSSIPAISTVVQPFESFYGEQEETNEMFFSRVSERLRHKNRAITHWDFEAIVLNNFHNIQQAKCLSYLTNPYEQKIKNEQEFLNIKDVEEGVKGISHKDGVVIVVVPKRTKYIDETTPRFNYKMLSTIEEQMYNYISPFVKVKVINPQYEYIRIICNVRFEHGLNDGVTLQRLHKDIRRFIAPWLDNDKVTINIGGSINENTIQNYIKSLSYVRFLTKFSILHILEEDGLYKLQDTAEEEEISIIQARPWGILLPDEDHEIVMVDREEEELPEKMIDTGKVITFQNRINIISTKKYIKILNPKFKKNQTKETVEKDTDYTLDITI